VNILAVSKAATAAMARRQAEQQQRKQNQRRSLADILPRASRSTQSLAAPSSPRPRRRSPRQLQPIQRLTNQAANNFKQTAKTVLPSPVYSTAKQAVNIFNNNLPRRRPRRNDVPNISLRSGDYTRSDFKTTNTLASDDGNISKEMDVDWYTDETMAMYL